MHRHVRSRTKTAIAVAALLVAVFAGSAVLWRAPSERALDKPGGQAAAESAIAAAPSRQAAEPVPQPHGAQPSVGAPVSPPALAGPPLLRPETSAVQPAIGQTDAAANAAPWDRMIIRNAALALRVENVEAALQQVRDIARAGGGFVSSSTTHVETADEQERMVATVVIQVRADAFDATVTALRRLAFKVDSEQVSTQDVTEEYIDLEANLRNLQASEAAILRLMDRAQRIEDILALQRELTGIRGQIERLHGRKRFLERRTEMASITITLRPLSAEPRPQVKGTGWEPLAAARRGWEASLTILRYVADGLIVALAFSWWLVPPLALSASLWLLRRGRAPASTASPPEA